MICADRIEKLREEVGARLSDKRYTHTLGVERAAARIGKYCLPDKISELSVAALLHDVAKEMPRDVLFAAMERSSVDFTAEDYSSYALYHAFAASVIIREEFSDLATDEILLAVFKHTSGDSQMSDFDEIIFVADFVEDGREYETCREIRESLFERLSAATSYSECLQALHSTVVEIIDFTIKYLEDKGKSVNSRMLLAKKAVLAKMS